MTLEFFSYSCRSGFSKTVPLRKGLKNELDLVLIVEVINKEFSIDNIIDSVI